MTIIKITKTKFNNTNIIKTVDISGHSGYANSGQDIVCAAISTLTQTTLEALITLLNLKIKHKINHDSGKLYFEILPDQDFVLNKENFEVLEKADLLLKTMMLGLESIAQSYPENLRII